jgi:antitoxin component of MazEF toxin-antitoxin module
MKVEKWGDDFAIGLPAGIAEFLRLEDGADVDIRISGLDTFDIEKRADRSGRSVRVTCYVHRRHPGAARA